MGSNIELGEGVFFPSFGVVLEIVLLRRKVDMMGKTFSSSFVRDCRFNDVETGFQVLDSIPNANR